MSPMNLILHGGQNTRGVGRPWPFSKLFHVVFYVWTVLPIGTLYGDDNG